MSTAIKVENLSKAYQLGEIGTGTITRDFERWFAKTRGKEDPFLKIGEENDRTAKGTTDIVWSLKDINFEITTRRCGWYYRTKWRRQKHIVKVIK